MNTPQVGQADLAQACATLGFDFIVWNDDNSLAGGHGLRKPPT